MKKDIFFKSAAITLAAVLLLCGCENSGPKKEEDSSKSQTITEASTTSETPADEEITSYSGYNLIWNDEFNGDTLNEDIWSYDPHEPGWTNEELQEYTESTDNVFTRDGKLVLKAIKSERDGKDYYTSGKIKSQNKEDFLYGKVVASAKVPEGQGLWPAIWMMPTVEEKYGQWPKCGEIDIMEVLGNDVTTAYSTVHYGEPHGEQQGTKILTDGSTYADSFHEYSVEWEPGEIRYYIDAELVLTVNDWFSAVQGEDEKPYPAPFDQTFFVQMNLAVGGTWPGNPDATTDFDKAEFEIDYVRVYQKDSYDTNVKKPEKQFREPLEDGNYIYNGDFSGAENLADDENWKFILLNGGEGEAEIKDNMIIISSTNAGTEEYSVQLVQPDLPMIKGKKYRVTFDAKAEEEREFIVCVSAPSAGWIRYLPDTKQALTTEMQTYTFEFEMTEKDDNNGRLEFNMGKYGETATIYITNVRVEEIE